MVVRAEACYPLQHGGAGYTAEKEEVEDARVGRSTMVFRTFTQVDDDFHRFSGCQHMSSFSLQRNGVQFLPDHLPANANLEYPCCSYGVLL